MTRYTRVSALAATAIVSAALVSTAAPAAASPVIRIIAGPVSGCAKSAPCREVAKRKAKDVIDDITRKAETAASWASDVAEAVRDGVDAASESFRRSAKGRRADEVHRLHVEALARKR